VFPLKGGFALASSFRWPLPPEMARRRHEAMSDMSPLLGAKQT